MKNPIGVKLDEFRDSLALRYAMKHLHESQLGFHGLVTCEHYRDRKLIHTQTGSNIFTTEGMAMILNCIFKAVATNVAIYVGIFKNDVTPLVTHTAVTHLGNAGTALYGECLDADYDSPATNKPVYTIATTATAVCTNTASKATFVMNAGITVYGAFLSTVAAKTASTGTLICAKKFTASRAVIADDELAVTYQVTCTSS